MKIGVVSSVNFCSENSRIKLENVNKDRIPYGILEKITDTQNIDIYLSKDSNIHLHPEFDIYRLKATKKITDFPMEVESKHIFITNPNASGCEMLSKITASLDKVIPRLYNKYRNTLVAINEINADSTVIRSAKKIFKKS